MRHEYRQRREAGLFSFVIIRVIGGKIEVRGWFLSLPMNHTNTLPPPAASHESPGKQEGGCGR